MDVDVGELSQFKSNALRAVSFTIVVSERELNEPGVCDERCMFSPLLAHQIFGERETIFGYKDLIINLFYHHNSSKCLLDIKYESKSSTLEVDDIPELMNDWLPKNYFTKKEDFKEMLTSEKSDEMFGTVIHEFEKETDVFIFNENEQINCTYKITQINTKDPLFQEYHERFETFIIWFIDAANFIDLSDERWLIFYMYEEFISPGSGKKIVTPIGFTAIYKFFSYPDSNRARISQFFILPTHQSKGLGTIFYNTIYSKILHDMPEIIDLTVEEPNELFQRMRDYCDSLHIYKDLKKNGGSLAVMSNKVLYNYFAKHKINKKQALRISDILQYLNAVSNGPKETKNFEEMLLTRRQLQKKMSESRLGKIARGANIERIIEEDENDEDLKAEVENYIGLIRPIVDKVIKIIEGQK